ncbi:MAG: type I-D CRISPR-associated protein Cas10d/Csc3, partial [Blastochloris sp.]|nr:type I-D CRISPR-associated protein Cas10d/Csc3 [Blastochloris sp.]
MSPDTHIRPAHEQEDDEDDIAPYDPTQDADAESLADELSTSAPARDAPKLAAEPLFSALFQHAIDDSNDERDTVLHDYGQHVIPHLSAYLAHVTAKGGEFAARHREEGRARAAHYSDDQSMRAHLLNGLLPTARIARLLRRWGVQRFEDEFDDTTYRLFCAGFTLHDWLKLPDVDEQLAAAGLRHDTVNAAQHLPLVEDILRSWCKTLGLDAFLAPLGPLDQHLHDLIYIACNTQVLWGTMHNLRVLCKLHAPRRRTLLATALANLADHLAYLGRTPVDAVAMPGIRRKLEEFSPDVALTYHHLSDVRGVLTNIINNAALEAYAHPDVREPLLYAPSGVVYLERRTAPPPPTVAAVAEAIVERIRNLCGAQLAHNLTGFGRDGKGLKYADYYDLFFSPRQFAPLVARAAEKRIVTTVAAGKRYDGILTKGMLPDDPALAATVEDCVPTRASKSIGWQKAVPCSQSWLSVMPPTSMPRAGCSISSVLQMHRPPCINSRLIHVQEACPIAGIMPQDSAAATRQGSMSSNGLSVCMPSLPVWHSTCPTPPPPTPLAGKRYATISKTICISK